MQPNGNLTALSWPALLLVGLSFVLAACGSGTVVTQPLHESADGPTHITGVGAPRMVVTPSPPPNLGTRVRGSNVGYQVTISNQTQNNPYNDGYSGLDPAVAYPLVVTGASNCEDVSQPWTRTVQPGATTQFSFGSVNSGVCFFESQGGQFTVTGTPLDAYGDAVGPVLSNSDLNFGVNEGTSGWADNYFVQPVGASFGPAFWNAGNVTCTYDGQLNLTCVGS
jgi:hypothetical protein